MSLDLLAHHTVYRDDRYYCGPGPAAVCDEGGRLLVAFRRVPSWLPFGHSGHWHPATESCLTGSSDGGQTWSSPQAFLGGYQCPCLRRLRDGALVHSTHRMELVPAEIAAACPTDRGVRDNPWPGVHAGTAVWRSEDGGLTWGNPAFLSGVPGIEPLHANLNQPVAVRGNVLETAEGRLLISAYSLNSPNDAYLFQSGDGGRSWSYVARIAENCNETFLYQTESGTLVAFLRHDEDTQLYQARSESGDEWSPAEPLCSGYPACALRLPSGRVLLVYGYRFDDGPGVRARLLSADCQLLDDDSEYILRDDGAVMDLGYPDACLLPDGRVFVVYYTNSKRDAPDSTAPRYIEACILAEA